MPKVKREAHLQRASAWVRRAAAQACRPAGVPLALACVLLASCGGEGQAEGVTYGDEIRPIFIRRCSTCHRPGGPSGVDIRNPFSTEPAPNAGMARALNQWKLRDPSLAVPEYDVKAGEPDNSFLIYKISNPALGLLPPDPDGEGPEIPPAGSPMPLHVPALSESEVSLLEDWVFAGAPNGSFVDRGDRATPPMRAPQARSFEADIRPLFGVEEELNQARGVCLPGQGTCAHCVYCHYAGTLNPPNLSDPFGPDGIVNVNAISRPDMMRVTPGDPEASLLIHKVRPGSSVQEYGPPMPYSYSALNQAQVDLVRQWILEGARP